MGNTPMHLAEKTVNYSLGDESNIKNLAETIQTAARPDTTPFIVSVGGPSAVGKSTLASKLADELPDADVLAIDDYLAEGLWDQSKQYSHDPSDETDPPYISGISPYIWDLDRLEIDIKRLQNGLPINRPVFDEQVKDRVGYTTFTPGQYLILEGGHSFSHRFLERAKFSLYVRATLHDRLMRKIVRSTKQYGLDEVDEVLSRYVARDEMSHRYYDPLFCETASRIVETATKPLKDYTDVAEDDVVQGNERILIPMTSTGTLHSAERLAVIDNERDLHIAYSVDDRLLICRKISSATLQLMQSCYELKN